MHCGVPMDTFLLFSSLEDLFYDFESSSRSPEVFQLHFCYRTKMYFSFGNTVSPVLVAMHGREEEVSCGAMMHENKLGDGVATGCP